MKKYFLFLSILFTGCELTSPPQNNNDLIHNIGYFKDPSTNLCFAAISSVSSGGYSGVNYLCPL
jgi:hypothetical protein